MGKVKNKEAWDKLKQFPIGTKVLVMEVMQDFGDPGSSRHKRARTHRWGAESRAPFEAWICGAKWLCDGEVESENYGGVGGECYEPPYTVTRLVVTKKTPVLLVREEMFGREMAVPVDGVVESPWGDPMKDVFMTRRSPLIKTYPWPKDHPYRKTMREEMAGWPRDARGRWVKTPGHVAHPEAT